MTERIATGISGLDEMLSGGFVPTTSTLVRGAPGTGKTTIGLNFLHYGAVECNEAGLLVTFEEFPRSLYRDAESLNLDLHALEASGGLTLQFTSPGVFLSSLQAPDSALINTIRTRNIKRVVVDSATHLTQLTSDEHLLRKHYAAMVNALKREQTTCILLGEETPANARIAEKGRLAFVADCIIMLRYLEIDSAIRRAIVVLKMRGSGHSKQIHQFEIRAGGLHVGKPFTGRRGLLSGLARRSMISTVR